MAERPGSIGLLPRAVHAAWGWRLEGGLLIAAVVGLRLAARLGPGGDLLLTGLVAIAFWRVPKLRRFAAARLREAVLRRRFGRALRACQVLGPYGFPGIGRVTPTPTGERIVVRVPLGSHAGLLETAAPFLAAALRVREVRVAVHTADASLATVEVVRQDPFAGPPLGWPWAEVGRTSLWRPVPLGAGESGQSITLGLPEHNLLLGGEPGAGKSAVLSLLVAAAALDPSVTLTLFDAKQVELAPWAGCADHFVGPDGPRAVDVLHRLRAEMDTRYERLLDEGRRKIAPADGLGLHVVAIDELAYFLRGGVKADRDGFAEGLRDLVSRGRAAGIVVLAATQKPSHDVVPTAVRDLFSYRMALRCTTPEASDTVLGQGWASQGYSAATIDPAARGVGFLLAEGGLPVKFRAAYLDDEAIRSIAVRAEVLRASPNRHDCSECS